MEDIQAAGDAMEPSSAVDAIEPAPAADGMQASSAGNGTADATEASAAGTATADAPETNGAAASGSPDASPAATPQATETAAPEAAEATLHVAGGSSSSTAAPTGPEGKTEEELLQEILELFPEEPPSDHAAWTRCNFQPNHKWPNTHFFYGSGPDRIRFQATVEKSTSGDLCCRLARVCFMKFEEGQSVEQVKEYRDEMYRKIKEVREGPPVEKPKKKKSDGPKEPKGPSISYDKTNGILVFRILEADEQGLLQKKKFTIRIRQCADDFQKATRVAELLVVKAEEGMGREELTQLRGKLYEACVSGGEITLDGMDLPPVPVKQEPKADDAAADAPNGAGTDEPAAKVAKVAPSIVFSGAAAAMLQAAKKDPDEEEKVKQESVKEGKVKKEKTEAVKAERQADTTTPAVKEATVKQEASEPSGPREDLPSEHEAWSKVKLMANGNCNFTYKGPDGSVKFQTTVRAAKGSTAEAMRIARLCYGKFASGATKQEVEAYRSGLYKELDSLDVKADVDSNAPVKERKDGKRDRAGGTAAKQEPVKEETVEQENGHEPDKKKRKKDKKTKKGDDAIIQRLKKEGRLAGALVVKGRDEAKKNASINGIYAPIAGGFEGSGAFEKIDSGAPRILFYHAGKSRWKIGEELNADKAFAWLTDDRGKGGGARPQTPADMPPGQQWRVFDGKGDGYKTDPAVQCVALDSNGTPAAPKAAKDGGRNVKAEKRAAAVKAEEDAGRTVKPDATGDKGVEESSNSSSDSSGESDSDSDDSSSAGNKADDVKPEQPGSAEPRSTSTPGLAAGQTPPGASPPLMPVSSPAPAEAREDRPPQRGKLCAKMLVRSRLRCSCHFSYIHLCPVARDR